MTHASSTSKAATAVCALTGQTLNRSNLVRMDGLRPSLAEFIRAEHPNLAEDAVVDRREISRQRGRMVEDMLRNERGELGHLEREVAQRFAEEKIISENVDASFPSTRSFGEQVSDRLAEFGGSWKFLIGFGIALAIWITFNASLGTTEAFDPYPFILLNLILSCIAAIQAPIIMMSQRRQETKDRMRSESDYRINMKAEIEIRHLHEKIDYLLSRQWERLAEIQAIQLEAIEQALAKRR